MPQQVQTIRFNKITSPPSAVHVKALQDPEDTLRFVVTDQSVDRVGDVIEVKGWNVEHFKQNPIALWQHDHEQPIGIWEDLKIENGQVSARLKFAEPGTSPRVDEARSFVEQRILKAASVGFMPLETEFRDPDNPQKGFKFSKAELLEISLVSVGANRGALLMSKHLLSPADRSRLLVAPDIPEPPIAKPTGATAVTIFPPEKRGMSTAVVPAGVRPTNSQRIQRTQQEINDLSDELQQLMEKFDESNEDETLKDQIAEVNRLLEKRTEALRVLEIAERWTGERVVQTVHPVQAGQQRLPTARRATPLIKPDVDLIFKTMNCLLKSYHGRMAPEQAINAYYGGDDALREFSKAAVGPALTTVSGWAAELVQQTYGEFIELFVGDSVFPKIAAIRTSFDATGKIVYPVEASSSPALAGSFVGEAQPIPVRKGAFSSQTILPYKMGVITTWSREIANQSNPVIEPLLRNAVVRNTGVAIDTALLDNNAAVTGVRPAGLQTYATGANTAPSTGTSADNILADIRGRLDRITSLNMGQRLQWVMHPSRLLGLQFARNALGQYEFPSASASPPSLGGYPIITSTTVPPAIVFLVDAASVILAIAPAPELRVDDVATLHMEDTSPKQIIPGPALPPGTAAPATIADIPTPSMSLFQVAAYALRLLWDMSWGVARPGAVQTITGVAW